MVKEKTFIVSFSNGGVQISGPPVVLIKTCEKVIKHYIYEYFIDRKDLKIYLIKTKYYDAKNKKDYNNLTPSQKLELTEICNDDFFFFCYYQKDKQEVDLNYFLNILKEKYPETWRNNFGGECAEKLLENNYITENDYYYILTYEMIFDDPENHVHLPEFYEEMEETLKKNKFEIDKIKNKCCEDISEILRNNKI